MSPGLEIKDLAIIISGAIAALSTLAAVLITNRFNYKSAQLNIQAQDRRNELERKFQKIEELYFLFLKWETTVINIYLHHLRCYYNKLDYASVMELTKKSEMFEPGDYQKLEMLMRVHFPSLIKEFAKIHEARGAVTPFISDPKESKLSAKDFVSAQKTFEAATEAFKLKMSNLAESL